jgi:HK97 family phage major capsid protein
VDLQQMIDAAKRRLDEALTERQKHTDGLAAMRTKLAAGDTTVTTEAVDGALAARKAVDDRIDAARAEVTSLEDEKKRDDELDALARQTRGGAPKPPAYDKVHRIGNEPRTYSMHKDRTGEASWFSDMYLRREQNDPGAGERLLRHGREVEVDSRSNPDMLTRAVTTSGFAGLVTPQWLLDLAAEPLRTGRPAANVCQGLPLPAEGMTLNIPRGTTGATAAAQATENTSVSSTDEVWADLQIPVRTVAGQQDVSRQSLERGMPGLDALVYLDLAGAYHAEIDRQVVTGSGASGEMLGIRLTAGINTATAFGAGVTAPTFVSKTAGQITAVASSGTKVQPNVWLAHPRRWGWLTSLSDTQGRPLVIPGVGGPMNVPALVTYPGGYSGDGDQTSTTTLSSVGSLHGLPLFTDANIPTNLGTPSEDVAFALDRRHMLLWEDGDGQPRQLRFEQTLGNQLTVKLVIYGYAAFTAGRYPTAVGRVGGADTVAAQGLVAPTF